MTDRMSCPICGGTKPDGTDRCGNCGSSRRAGDNSLDTPFWYGTRVDEDNGDIRYEAFGPDQSFVVFRGPKAKEQNKAFVRMMKDREKK